MKTYRSVIEKPTLLGYLVLIRCLCVDGVVWVSFRQRSVNMSGVWGRLGGHVRHSATEDWLHASLPPPLTLAAFSSEEYSDALILFTYS